MLDDDRLASLLDSAGRAFEVPPTGAHDILTRAAGVVAGDGAAPEDAQAAPGRRTGVARRAVTGAGRHRVLTVAACLGAALVAAAGITALVRGPGGPTETSALAHPAKSATSRGTATTTTEPTHLPASGGLAARPRPDSTEFGVSAPALPNGAVGEATKVQQTGTLALAVARGRLGAAMTELTGLAGAYDGFVASSQTQSGTASGAAPSGTVTLEVPVDAFTTVLKQAQKVGRTTSLATNATDVTSQYVDLQSRISALEASRQQYLTILAKATTVGDVLAVQAQIDTIQSQVEQLQGQLQVLTSQTTYSKLTIDVAEGTPPSPPAPAPTSGVVRAWHDGIGGFVDGVEGLIRLAGPLLFALLCAAAVLLGGRILWRRLQRHRL